MQSEHPFAKYIKIIGKGKNTSRHLTYEESYQAFNSILYYNIEDIQLGAFLILMRLKEENKEEIAGFSQACRNFLNTHNEIDNNIDININWPSYSGKKQQLTWFIIAILLLSDYGYKIIIHSTTININNRLNIKNIFQYLNLPISKNSIETKKQINEFNITLLLIDNIYQPLKQILKLRNILGLRSPIQTLIRLINPFNSKYSFQSIFHPKYTDIHQYASKIIKQKHALAFKGNGGEIEINPYTENKIQCSINYMQYKEKWPKYKNKKKYNDQISNTCNIIKIYQDNLNNPYSKNTIINTLAIILKIVKKYNTQKEAFLIAESIWKNRKKCNLFLKK